MKATGFSDWQGTWKEGTGTLSTKTDTLKNKPYSFSSRFEGTPGASPEELLATAHAGCFNQALANNFGMISLVADSIQTSVEIDLQYDAEGRPTIFGSHITVEAKAAGASDEQMQYCAERASRNCSISKALNCKITFSAVLIGE